jgi:hypothetical protein
MGDNRRQGYAAPDPRIGYYVGGAPRYGGTGSMAGPRAAGTVTGAGMSGSGGEGWTPTIKFLVGLVLGELLLYGALRRYTSHGG